MNDRPIARWQLIVGMFAFLGTLRLIVIADGLGSVLLFLLALAVLGAAAWLWGHDSRDGADWKTR
jgi:hypothetical protein